MPHVDLKRLQFRGVPRALASPRTPRAERTLRALPTLPDPVVGFAGRIEPGMRQLDLVRAFARLRLHFSRARLELVGPIADRAYAARVRAAIARSRLEDAVTFAGRVKDVASQIRHWDLFVSLTSGEAQERAVLEAMALGVPVVARPLAEIGNLLVDGRTGFAITNDETKRAALTMLRACKDHAARKAVARRARAMIERLSAARERQRS